MKVKLVNESLQEFVNEEIHASEAYTDAGALNAMIAGKKDVALISLKFYPELKPLIDKNNFGCIKVQQTHHDVDTNIVYRKTKRGKRNAEKLHQIMISHGGYVQDQSPEEAYEIGKLLDYTDESIHEFIDRVYRNKK